MRHIKLTYVFTILLFHTSLGQQHPDWEESDKRIISLVTRLNREDPKEVETLFSKCLPIRKDTLGFGWTQSAMALAGGYITIWACFYYYNDSIVSYTILPQIPSDPTLSKRYLEWYYPYYTKFDTLTYQRGREELVRIAMTPYRFNGDRILQPLREFETGATKKPISYQLLQYMSPESGVYYGWGGGLPPTIFPNRKLFNSLKDSLTIDDTRALLYSINPASRLTAIEYCIKKNYPILKDPGIAKWIDRIYHEVPVIKTLDGCFGSVQNSKQMVERYSKFDTGK